MNRNAMMFIEAATEIFGDCAVLNREQIQRVCDEKNVLFPYWFVTKPSYRDGRGLYKLPALNKDTGVKGVMLAEAPVVENVVPIQQANVLRQKKLQDDTDSAIPDKFPGFVPFGFYKDLLNIVETKMFYPVFITGLSGNGKTLMVEQVCAVQKRECIRVNISIETDESDLIGTNTLVDGNIVYRDGPVITAMKRGSILLIDEVDRGSNKLLCLQGILEGKPYFNKKSGEYVHPTPGFNIIATANTKGRGSEEGKFLSQILDDAFLERFPITIEQNYPDHRIELKILKAICDDANFCENLVKWADIIRRTYNDGGVDEIISTRRLVHIVRAHHIFEGNRKKAIDLCISRFDTETKKSFLDLYTKVDVQVTPTAAEPVPVSKDPLDELLGEF